MEEKNGQKKKSLQPIGKPEKEKKQRIKKPPCVVFTISIPVNLHDEFLKVVADNYTNRTKRINQLIKQDIETWKMKNKIMRD